ncbi:MAG: SMP-30/gluconolactonase/LRE family protein [Caulobacteraceae bacterium]
MPAGDRCGEAATWDEEAEVLFWCDVNRFLIHALDRSGAVRNWFFDEPVVALALTDQIGTLLVALASHLILWRPEEDDRRDFGHPCPGWPKARWNDGRAGPAGEFWIGSMANNVGSSGEDLGLAPGLGELHRVRSGEEPMRFKEGIGISNTLAWAADHGRFYFGDSMANVVWAFDYDRAAAQISAERPFLEGFERGFPDGSATDVEGALWNCRYGGGCLVRVLADGAIEQIIEAPVTHVTTCAFGGPDLTTLFVTSAAHHAERLSGSLFALEVAVPGAPSHRVKL